MDELEMVYLDDDKLAWTNATGDQLKFEPDDKYRDCNGASLQSRDSVTLKMSLDVNG